METKSITDAPGAEIKEKEKTQRFDYDAFWKNLINRFFWNLLEMALPDLYADADTSREHELLDTKFTDVLNTNDPEIHTSPHFADYVIKVHMKNGDEQWLILHVEIQGKGGEDLPGRMHHYKCLIFAHYKKEPVALAIITDKRPGKEALSYSYYHYGTKSVYEYNNLVITDLDDDVLLSSSNPIALVFYAAKAALKVKEELQKFNYLRTLTGLLAERGWDRNEKRDLLLFIIRIINLKDEALQQQYWAYRQQLDKEGKLMYEPFLKQVEERMAEQRGRAEGKEEMARELMANGVSPDIIARSAGLPVERVRALVN